MISENDIFRYNISINAEKLYNKIENYIDNSSYLIVEKEIKNVITNFNKIIHLKFPYYTNLNINAIINSNNIIDLYLKNKNIKIISNVPTFIFPIIINKISNHNIKSIDTQLFFNDNIFIKNNNQKFINILKKTKLLKKIENDYNTNLDIPLTKLKNEQSIIKDRDVIVCAYFKPNKETIIEFIKTFLIGLTNLKEDGTMIYYISLYNNFFDIKYISFYTLLCKIFNNIEINKIPNFNYISNYFVTIRFNNLKNLINDSQLLKLIDLMLENKLENNNLSDIINFTKEDNKKSYKLVNDLNNFKREINDFLINTNDYFTIEPENYSIYYTMFLLKDISVISLYFNKNNIKYDHNYLLSYYTKYYQKHINKFFSFNRPIKEIIINTDKKLDYSLKNEPPKTKKINKIQKTYKTKKHNITNESIRPYKPYAYEYFNKKKNSLLSIKKLQEYFLNRLNLESKYVNLVATMSDIISRNITNYIKINYKLPYNINNSFLHHWEILRTFTLFSPNQNSYNSFHLNEMNGQFIWSCKYFIQNTMKMNKTLNWYASSLNKDSIKFKRLQDTGQNLFKDIYGFMKNYQNRWIYGADNTGDLTQSKNIISIRDKSIKKGIIFDVITSDIKDLSKINIYNRQKLELSQLCSIAAISTIGKNCVVKCYLPFFKESDTTYSGQFISIIYIYYRMFEHIYLFKPKTSNTNDTEFYIIGKGFKGISQPELKKLLHILDNFKINQMYIDHNIIPDNFISHIYNFIDQISELNTYAIEVNNCFINCLTDENEEIKNASKCLDYINQDVIKNLQKQQFNEWSDIYLF
jgi:hypothetical protein